MEMNYTDKELHNYINLLLDNDTVFEEFNCNPLNNITKEEFFNMFEFAKASVDIKDYFLLMRYAMSTITLNVLLNAYNLETNTDISLSDLVLYNDYSDHIIEYAKYVNLHHNLDLKQVLFYTFAYAKFCLKQARENKRDFKIIKKAILKPVSDKFHSEYDYILNARRS